MFGRPRTPYRNRQVEKKAKNEKKKENGQFFLFCLQKGKKNEQVDIPMTVGVVNYQMKTSVERAQRSQRRRLMENHITING